MRAPARADAAVPRVIQHLHLGDSYSAGNGAGSYAATPPDCRRSDNAWGMQVGRAVQTQTGTIVYSTNRACSGAIAWDVDHEEKLQNAAGTNIPWEEASPRIKTKVGGGTCADKGADYLSHYKSRRFLSDECKYFLRPQTDWVTRSTNLVTLTIGGNDLGFADVVGKCFILEQLELGWLGKVSDLSRSCKEYLDTAQSRLRDTGPDGEEARIRRVLTAISDRMDPTGTIVYLGYPSLIDNTVTLRGSVPSDTPQQVRNGQLELDALQRRIVQEMDARPGVHPKMVFVSPLSLFYGHEILKTGVSLAEPNPDRWFVAPVVDKGFGDKDLWYHPTLTGHTEEAKLVAGSIPALPTQAAGAARALDIVFVIDTTGSMGTSIASVKAAVVNLLGTLDGISSSWRAAVVSYRDFASRTGSAGDYPSLVISGFTSDRTALTNAVNSLVLGDGGDLPETMYSGIMTALDLPWRAGVEKRVVVMTDAAALDPEPITGYTASTVVNKALAVDPAQFIGLPVTGASAASISTLTNLVNQAGGVMTTPSANTGTQLSNAVASVALDPVAWLGGPYVAKPGATVTFDASRSADPGGTIVRYEWDVDGNGTVDRTTTAPTLSVTFDAPYLGLAAVRVVSSTGRSAKASADVRITTRPDSALSTLTGFYAPVVPTRVLDTRTGTGAKLGRVPAGGTVELDLTTSSLRLAAGTGVALNVTVDRAAAPGYVTVWPCDAPRPLASNLNYVTGSTVPNLVVTASGATGKVCLYSSQEVDLVADAQGWMPAEFHYQPVVPERLLDTRVGTGVARGRVRAGSTVELQVTGAGASRVPTENDSVLLNVTVDGAAGPGFVTVWPCGAPRPLASNLNYVTGSTVPNLVVTGTGDGGRVCLYSSQDVDLVGDLEGWVDTGSSYVARVPKRVLDTRNGTGAPAGPVAAGATLELTLPAGTFGDDLGGSVVLNVTVDQAAAPGFATVWPCGTPRPLASNLNFVTGSTVPNLVIAGVGAGGKVCFSVSNATHLVADLSGSLAADEPLRGRATIVG